MAKEVRIYLINEEEYNKWLGINNITTADKFYEEYVDKITDDEWIEMSENCGLVYTLKNFVKEWNFSVGTMCDSEDSFMRIFEVETSIKRIG